jgi:hypothetical protein
MTLVGKQDTGHRVAEQCEAYRDNHGRSPRYTSLRSAPGERTDADSSREKLK